MITNFHIYAEKKCGLHTFSNMGMKSMMERYACNMFMVP